MAKILAEAEMFSDEAVAKRWDITARTIRNYRKRETSDPAFSSLFRHYQKILNAAWSENATFFINKAIAQLAIRTETLENNAFTFTAIANSIKIVGELKIDWEALTFSSQQNETDTEIK